MLRWRLISAAVILAVLLTIIWLDFRCVFFAPPGAWLLPLLLAVAALATEEVLSLVRARGHRPIGWLVYVGNLLIPLTAGLPILLQLAALSGSSNPLLRGCNWPLAALAVMTAMLLVGEMCRFQGPGTAIVEAALSIFALVYVGLFISFWALLRLHRDNEWGMAGLFSMLLIVKMADTGAFAFGKAFGKRKLTPILSPGKTWEGVIGGVATACLTSWAFFQFAAPEVIGSTYVQPSAAASLTYGLLLALAGIIGDLTESLLKRDMQRKDSSTWLPGLGGVLDIIDAPLIAGPVAWLCWTLGLLGP